MGKPNSKMQLHKCWLGGQWAGLPSGCGTSQGSLWYICCDDQVTRRALGADHLSARSRDAIAMRSRPDRSPKTCQVCAETWKLEPSCLTATRLRPTSARARWARSTAPPTLRPVKKGNNKSACLFRHALSFHLCPHGDSNPGFGLERAASWASRRWGRQKPCRAGKRRILPRGGGEGQGFLRLGIRDFVVPVARARRSLSPAALLR